MPCGGAVGFPSSELVTFSASANVAAAIVIMMVADFKLNRKIENIVEKSNETTIDS